MYSLIAIDCDGTLLKDDKTISKRNMDSLKALEETEVILAIASGRAFCGVKHILDNFNKNYPVITLNGAKVVYSKTNEVIFEEMMDYTDCFVIEKLSIEYDFTMFVWSNDLLFTNKFNDCSKMYSKASYAPLNELTDFIKLVTDGIHKIVFFIEKDLYTLHKQFKSLLKNSNCEPSTPYLLEFNSNNASKGIAVKNICQYFNISLDNTICIGDAHNDISMIEISGLGVAMENSHQDIKDASKHITSSNEMDGVSEVIEKFIFNKKEKNL